MRGFWQRRKTDYKEKPPSADTKDQENRLSGLRPLHFDPNDERMTSDERDYESRSRIRGSG